MSDMTSLIDRAQELTAARLRGENLVEVSSKAESLIYELIGRYKALKGSEAAVFDRYADALVVQTMKELEEVRKTNEYLTRENDQNALLCLRLTREREESRSRVRYLELELEQAKKKISALRGVLHIVSLDEYESTTSASDKVHAHANQARKVLEDTK
jgi:hypothetical protein